MVVRESIRVFQELSFFVCSMYFIAHVPYNYRVRHWIKFCAAMEERRCIQLEQVMEQSTYLLSELLIIHFGTPLFQCCCTNLTFHRVHVEIVISISKVQ